VDAFAARATSSRLPERARAQALVALAFVNDPRAAQAMADATRSPLEDVAAQAAWWMTFRKANDWRAYAVTGWMPHAAAAPPASLPRMRALQGLVQDAAARIDARVDAALAMARDPAGARLLLASAAKNQLAYQLREAAASVIFTNPDPAVQGAATAYFPRPGGAPAHDVAAIAARDGDAARGRLRFLGTCASCHQFAGAGAHVGPDLTDIRRKFDRTGVTDAIVRPGAGVAFGYGGELFVTGAQEPHIGFLEADGTSIAIRDSNGRTVTMEARELAVRVPLKGSIMPDPVLLGLSDQDVADIASFLMAGPGGGSGR
jgi:putative heme-binding domain-containing protein